MTVKEWQKEVYSVAKSKGWHSHDGPADEKRLAQMLINIHGEVSEAWEDYRANRKPNEIFISEGGKPEGIPIEAADIVIRVMDMCEYYGIDLEQAIATKNEYNKTRPHRHGGKRA